METPPTVPEFNPLCTAYGPFFSFPPVYRWGHFSRHLTLVGTRPLVPTQIYAPCISPQEYSLDPTSHIKLKPPQTHTHAHTHTCMHTHNSLVVICMSGPVCVQEAFVKQRHLFTAQRVLASCEEGEQQN